MNSVTPENVKSFVTRHIEARMTAEGRDGGFVVSDNCDLLLSGAIDSLGLLELITSIQEHYGREIDFETLDPERATILGPLCNFVAEKLAEG